MDNSEHDVDVDMIDNPENDVVNSQNCLAVSTTDPQFWRKKSLLIPLEITLEILDVKKFLKGFSFRASFVRAGIKMSPNFLRGLMTTTGEGRKIQANAVFDVIDCATGRIKLYK